ncbi:hypothetical protein GCWU000325_02136 [Alloprevotella tannerae ATCC 51259]|uniref:Uncharacterized protein n=1 Tax=Alloprevotella tannerae ATCC 51259 TaxID=626522 RepID=C9LIS7_9BACT|nr:hypothetical protein GCWU000325_02136 [Alloprevotella tannerae ATCC 51259]
MQVFLPTFPSCIVFKPIEQFFQLSFRLPNYIFSSRSRIFVPTTFRFAELSDGDTYINIPSGAANLAS